MKRKKDKPSKRNPVAREVRKLRPQIVPDRRRKKLDRAEKQDIKDVLENRDEEQD